MNPMPKRPPAKILVVDDEAAQMKALCVTLREQGYETTGHASAQAALADMDGTKFDLLLTDLMMPEMDGITLLQAAMRKDSHLVGVIMTGEGTITTAVEAARPPISVWAKLMTRAERYTMTRPMAVSDDRPPSTRP